jgi:hypothetical protein
VDHRDCQTQTTNAFLNKVVAEMGDYAKKISFKLKIADMQVKEIEKVKQNTMKVYKNWEEHSDIQLEWFINKLKVTKSEKINKLNKKNQKL